MSTTVEFVTAVSGGPEPDFMALPLQTTAGEDDSGAEPVFAPTDPVLGFDPHGRPHILGGFSTDSMAALEVDASADDSQPGDEALADAIRRELREDAATSTLSVVVFVRRGLAHLRGYVADLDDADNAAAVADRVPGLRGVIEELDVPG